MIHRPRFLYYWDADCFVSRLTGDPDRAPVLNAIIDAARAGQVRIYSSSLVLVEVLEAEATYPTEVEAAIQRFFRSRFVPLVAVDQVVARIARDLRRKHGLRVPDAVHLASAIHAGVSELRTYDIDLLRLDGQLPRKVLLRIKEPSFQLQLPLPSEGAAQRAELAPRSQTQPHAASYLGEDGS